MQDYNPAEVETFHDITELLEWFKKHYTQGKGISIFIQGEKPIIMDIYYLQPKVNES